MTALSWVTLAGFALLLLAGVVVADIIAGLLLYTAARWDPLRRAIHWVMGENEVNHLGWPRHDKHRALTKFVSVPGEARHWVAACECGWTGDMYSEKDYAPAVARTFALLDAEDHVIEMEEL